MSLDTLIPPEITSDSFASALEEISSRSDLRTYLEIGSSSGAGSTRAIVNGILRKESFKNVRLFCMELSRRRFVELYLAFSSHPFVVPYNCSSMGIEEFPSVECVAHFYNQTQTNLNRYQLSTVLDWLAQDLEYISSNCLNYCGIDVIKSCNRIDLFDFVLIDGSEFTGEVELQKVWGAKLVALDDVNSFKCFSAYIRLKSHYAYRLLVEDLSLRNGWAIFERIY